MKALISLLLIGSLLLAGCSSPVLESTEVETPDIVNEVTVESEGNIYATPVDYTTTEKSSVGFNDGLYTIGNFAPGRQADLAITLHNGGDEACTIAIEYRTPDFVDEEYIVAPKEAKDWLIIPEPLLELKPKEKRGIILTVSMPENAEVASDWEFWVAIKDASQTGTVRTEGCVRVFVNMQKE